MAIRFTVYCKRSAAHVTPEELLVGVREADLHTIAEGDDVPEAMIVSALQQLRIANVDPSGFRFYRLSYRPDGHRQIDIDRWQTEGEVRGDIAEVLDDIEHKQPAALARIRSHLTQVVDVISASFGTSDGESMASTLAAEVARWLAEQFEGIIRAADDSWWKLGKYHEYQPL